MRLGTDSWRPSTPVTEPGSRYHEPSRRQRPISPPARQRAEELRDQLTDAELSRLVVEQARDQAQERARDTEFRRQRATEKYARLGSYIVPANESENVSAGAVGGVTMFRGHRATTSPSPTSSRSSRQPRRSNQTTGRLDRPADRRIIETTRESLVLVRDRIIRCHPLSAFKLVSVRNPSRRRPAVSGTDRLRTRHPH